MYQARRPDLRSALCVIVLPARFPASQQLFRSGYDLPGHSDYMLSDAELWLYGIDLPTLLLVIEEARYLPRHAAVQRQIPAIHIVRGHEWNPVHAPSGRV